MRRLILPALLACAAVSLAQVKLTPRDAFWSASDLVGNVSANPAAHKSPVHAPHPRHTQTAQAGSSTPTAPPADATAADDAGPAQAGGGHVSAELISENGYGARPHFAEASLHVQQLGLRYSLLLRGDDGAYHEVAPGTVFHSGDHLRLSVMANEPGYLYVIEKGSSGTWSPLFPAPDAAADANQIEQGQPYQLPGAGHAFRFDQQLGAENLYVLLSRQPIPDLQGAIDHLRASQGQPAASPGGQMLVAENRIPDEIVQRLVGRDLSLVDEQQVNQPSTADTTGEKAVYVVAKASAVGGNGQVAAHIVLKHE